MRVDYHVHSKYSFDGKDTLEDICREAVARRLDEICFTEHFSMDFKDVSFRILDVQAYLQSIERCRRLYHGRLTIKKGLEIGEPHLEVYVGDLRSALQEMDLDFIIGSVHNLQSIKLRRTLPGKSNREVYQSYFEEILKMVSMADIDIIGHMDLMKRYAYASYGNYAFADFRAIIQAILEKAIARDIGLELNTSGFRNHVREPYPALAILKFYRQLGGRYITIGSDSHSCADLGSHGTQATAILREAGFQSAFTYTKRVPQEIPLVREK